MGEQIYKTKLQLKLYFFLLFQHSVVITARKTNKIQGDAAAEPEQSLSDGQRRSCYLTASHHYLRTIGTVLKICHKISTFRSKLL